MNETKLKLILPSDTRQILKAPGPNIESRSLFFTKYIDPSQKEQRKDYLQHVADKLYPIKEKVKSYVKFVSTFPNSDKYLLFGELKSRMMINMAGGVLENAGLCLDRFGIPYIPGSAIKGCARRTALAALREWCTTEQKPPSPLAECCNGFDTQEDMLETILLTFGWCSSDWTDNNSTSDLRWACADKASKIMPKVKEKLARRLGVITSNETPSMEDLPDYSGSVSFLPAYPVKFTQSSSSNQPEFGRLQLDVITCHHMEYYSGRRDFATDDEDPNPVYFLAVAPGEIYVFPVIPIRHNADALADLAKRWLATGLSFFGIGAKTNAGYGWFDVSESVQSIGKNAFNVFAPQRPLPLQDSAEKTRGAAQKDDDQALSPFERCRKKYAQMDDDSFAGQSRKFDEMSDIEKQAFVYVLKHERRETAKRWAKNKPYLLEKWKEYGNQLNPPVTLP